jgi:D-tyrosyl-tRNA(Tyr) deacylase
MRLVVQRVAQASVSVLNEHGFTPVSSIGSGLMVLVGIATDDNDADMEWAARKLLTLRLFNGPVVAELSCQTQEASPTVTPTTEAATAPTTQEVPQGTFAASAGKPWSRNVMEVNGSVLLVSQFTLCHVLKGNKPDFHNAMKGGEAKVLYDKMQTLMGTIYRPERILPGAFGEHMHVSLVNDGPVTLTLDSKNKS